MDDRAKDKFRRESRITWEKTEVWGWNANTRLVAVVTLVLAIITSALGWGFLTVAVFVVGAIGFIVCVVVMVRHLIALFKAL